MPTLTAVKTGEENFTFFTGSEPLPALSAFLPSGNTFLYFYPYGGPSPLLCNEFNVAGSDWNFFYYAMNNDGWAEITATVDWSIIPGTGYPDADYGYDFFYVAAMGYDNPGNGVTVAGNIYGAVAGINDGVQPLALGLLGSGSYNFGIIPSYNSFLLPGAINTNGPLGPVTLFAMGDGGGTWDFYFLVPDGGGGIDALQVALGIPDVIFRLITYDGARYNAINNNGQLVSFIPTAVGGADDAVVYDIDFDSAFLNDCFQNGYVEILPAGDKFLLIIYEDGSGPVPIQLLLVESDWSGYVEVSVSGGDAVTQTILDNYILGNSFPSFAYDPLTGAYLMTDGEEPPMFYSFAGMAPPVTVNRTTLKPFPFGLPCIIPCIPVIDRRRK